MAYSSSNLQLIVDTFSGGPKTYLYRSTDSHGTVEAAGFFAGAGAAGRSVNHGMRAGDLVMVAMHSTGGSSAATLHVVSACTANQSDTGASTGYDTVYNCSITAAAT